MAASDNPGGSSNPTLQSTWNGTERNGRHSLIVVIHRQQHVGQRQTRGRDRTGAARKHQIRIHIGYDDQLPIAVAEHQRKLVDPFTSLHPPNHRHCHASFTAPGCPGSQVQIAGF
jgi:hypothetical protein